MEHQKYQRSSQPGHREGAGEHESQMKEKFPIMAKRTEFVPISGGCLVTSYRLKDILENGL
jgi:hypothetical protein